MVAIVSRRDWGATTSIPGGRHVAPSARRFFVVHWPVMGSRDERQWCRDIERMHRGQGWQAAPGYNFLVGMSGTVYEGCGRDVRGIHSPPRNTDGWGVCVLQPSTANGTPTAPISQAAMNATRALYEQLSATAGRRLSMWWHGRDWATACPGGDLRNWVASGMPSTGQPPPGPAPPPAQGGAMALVKTKSGNGYYIFGADGGVFAFGDAAFRGSLPGLGVRPAGRIVDGAITPSGNGYWMAGSDGGVFCFGDASFRGSASGLGIRGQIVAMDSDPDTGGYWLLGSDGGVFAFGAPFHGSAAGHVQL